MGNRKCSAYGHQFDSLAEREYFFALMDAQKKGLIHSLRVHHAWQLFDQAEIPANLTGKKKETMKQTVYIPDFEFFDVKQMRYRVIDVKGFRTEAFKLKKKWMWQRHHIYVEEIKIDEVSKV